VDAQDPDCTDSADLSELRDCADGLDNDGDGLIDLYDPGCVASEDPQEVSPGIGCDDGIDNDRDGRTDLHDPQCSRPQDESEFVPEPGILLGGLAALATLIGLRPRRTRGAGGSRRAISCSPPDGPATA